MGHLLPYSLRLAWDLNAATALKEYGGTVVSRSNRYDRFSIYIGKTGRKCIHRYPIALALPWCEKIIRYHHYIQADLRIACAKCYRANNLLQVTPR
ncbi:hypothetical protein JQK15_26200 [Sphingobium sp. BHU LFT2]|uniref:hypothetical protein n=1 Tax=Sphingobium sp. BHU LFT2 TaxID=2807634 RepID=UPI001BEA7F56|nr:hypothetical protein [Sphingobium sp. BHU LFT2]MBT2246990.1 hypothetical protein [Sphingobium sp. BHU LFT2]